MHPDNLIAFCGNICLFCSTYVHAWRRRLKHGGLSGIRARDKAGEAEEPTSDGAPALTIDWDLYAQYLEGSGLTEAEKREFIEVLWSIVVSFVDLGLGLHPAQLATGKSCEQNEKSAPDETAISVAVVSSLMSTKPEFEASANRSSAPVKERSPE